MKTYNYHTQTQLPISVEDAWQFFSAAGNLAKITPPELGFIILTDLSDKAIHEGMLIDYTVRPLLSVPLHWQTEITDVRAPFEFTDRQLKGPYSKWVHHHMFEANSGGVLMTDDVEYALPFGWIGTMTHQFVVRKKIEDIFDFRREAFTKIFANEHSYN